MTIDFANLKQDYLAHQEEINQAIASTLNSAQFILGEAVEKLESELTDFVGCKYATTCSSGTSALLLALMALGIKSGDEVLTTSFSFFATAEVIALLGAKPVFVDIYPDTFNLNPSLLESHITPRTKAIIAVSLFGQTSDMDTINSIAQKHSIPVIEDGAQSFGATYKGKKSGNLSTIGITSFFPAKPLGCFGDGGAIFCNDEILDSKLKSLRNHGQTERYKHHYIGLCARLDTLQASILSIKLKHFPDKLAKRQEAARLYSQELKNLPLTLPTIKEGYTSSFAQFSILEEKREALLTHLKAAQIPTAIHYPTPLPHQEAFAYLNIQESFPHASRVASHILSLPLNPYLSQEEVLYICKNIKDFYAKS